MMNTRQVNDLLTTLAPHLLVDPYDTELDPATVAVVAAVVGRDDPDLTGDVTDFALESRQLEYVRDGSLHPSEIDPRFGSSDADWSAAVERQTERVDDSRFTLRFGHVRPCVDCKRTTCNYEPAAPNGLYCPTHAETRRDGRSVTEIFLDVVKQHANPGPAVNKPGPGFDTTTDYGRSVSDPVGYFMAVKVGMHG